ncbi:carboxypeptidase-like regulatory domain-containing protein [Lacinutrix neustonica]|uniref:Carboxypeptidase-like regulatory domain-containing protein n=1 Tax=Lacinutrix neustonica TaxID=2980107 RepID=A0A9E8SEU6_9FLAO|nr:carboxypeptidase-like regulatory domain-containing protein [Lacinutrix neustonica]WAC03591.1 carboxypeptidase-like regulatory domain-containing protein [Lacinutrix neustonica]
MKTKFSGILTLLLAFVVQLTFAQEKTISGSVSDESGLPLPGVNVIVAGTNDGTQTDFDGKYSISANTGDVLTYSYIGYKSVNKTVGTENNISFSLELDVAAIDEVVITALGIKRKPSELAYATTVVKQDALTQAAPVNVVTGLVGKASV